MTGLLADRRSLISDRSGGMALVRPSGSPAAPRCRGRSLASPRRRRT